MKATFQRPWVKLLVLECAVVVLGGAIVALLWTAVNLDRVHLPLLVLH